jgi:hypothetical protein
MSQKTTSNDISRNPVARNDRKQGLGSVNPRKSIPKHGFRGVNP